MQDAIFESHHPSQRFVNVLSQYRCGPKRGSQQLNPAQLLPCLPTHSLPSCRSTFPAALWEKVESHFPDRRRAHPACVDIAIGAEGRGGVELARRWDWV